MSDNYCAYGVCVCVYGTFTLSLCSILKDMLAEPCLHEFFLLVGFIYIHRNEKHSVILRCIIAFVLCFPITKYNRQDMTNKMFSLYIPETRKFNINLFTSGKGCHAISFHDGRKKKDEDVWKAMGKASFYCHSFSWWY